MVHGINIRKQMTEKRLYRSRYRRSEVQITSIPMLSSFSMILYWPFVALVYFVGDMRLNVFKI